MSSGPFHGLRVLDLTGLGPGPYCAMLLGDLGADVVRVERPGSGRFSEPEKFIPHRSRRSVVIDLTKAAGVELVLRMVDGADVLIEGNRPGVMERLGLGPDVCLARNERLVYARLTGWGQDGPLANDPGHDINYIATAGALGRFRRAGERPVFPLNLAADLGGGGAVMAFGIAAALFERSLSGIGQVIDGAMIDGLAGQLALPLAHRAMGRLAPAGENFYDSGAHYYEVYETADHRYLAVGAIEPKFYAVTLQRLGLADRTDLPGQNDRSGWPMMKELFASVIEQRTLAEWTAVFDGAEACVTPVLELDEALTHPHALAHGTYVEHEGVVQPGVAPRFSRTPGALDRVPPATGQHTDEVLAELGCSAAEIARLRADGTIA
ncbi:MAG: CaiB/BaiF CoA-transferase family protein [Actinomycetota bacterium]|nr:CaiB/BaiF CoA-transferase family protein [Actinomycetota bacterium]